VKGQRPTERERRVESKLLNKRKRPKKLKKKTKRKERQAAQARTFST
jgi:hypothetical protein